jgi:hypothetical protein
MAFIIYRNDNDIAEPKFQCDRCGKLIDDAFQAIVVWNEEHKPEEIVPLVICRTCDDPPGSGRCRKWMELNSAIAFLLNNTGLTGQKLERAKARAALLAAL